MIVGTLLLLDLTASRKIGSHFIKRGKDVVIKAHSCVAHTCCDITALNTLLVLTFAYLTCLLFVYRWCAQGGHSKLVARQRASA
jgi:hypothetical protein